MISPIDFQNHPVIALSDEDNEVLISPDHGARILRWTTRGREVITWPDNADWSAILKVRGGNPVLFPFIARHFVNGQNELWRDARGEVRSMPQHGFARDAKFHIIENSKEAGKHTVRLRLTDSPETQAMYPFSFQFDVVIRLRPESNLEVRFETTNTGIEHLPYYAGHHFYFALPHGDRKSWRLNLPCASWARQDATGQIIHEETGSELLRLDDPSLVDRFAVQPLSQRVTLFHIRENRRLHFELRHSGSVPWYAITTWTQKPESDFYCIEPWLGLPNAIHHREGLRRVASGDVEVATLVLDAKEWVPAERG